MSERAIKIKAKVDINQGLSLDEIDEHAEDALNNFYGKFTEVVDRHKDKLRERQRVKDARFLRFLHTPCSQYTG